MKEFKLLLTKRIVVTVDAEDFREAEINVLDGDANSIWDTEWGEANPKVEIIGERDVA